MDTVDATHHVSMGSEELPPSLLTIVLDTNPYGWAHLAPTLPIKDAISNLIVFLNAHLAFNNANRVAVVASHLQKAEFLYPLPSNKDPSSSAAAANGDSSLNGTGQPSNDANFYRPFALLSAALTKSLAHLLNEPLPNTQPAGTPTTSLAGALTLALTYANKLSVELTGSSSINATSTNPTAASDAPTTTPAAGAGNPHLPGAETETASATTQTLTARILVLSCSPSSPAQYIPLMNAIFACQRLHVPVDVLALHAAASPFLQQAADATRGTWMALGAEPRALLQVLMQAFLPGPPSRAALVQPAAVGGVDFRAACFCHRREVDIGYVCGVCLSIFCHVLEDGVCLTCGSALEAKGLGRKPAVVPRKKKKKKRDGAENGSATKG